VQPVGPTAPTIIVEGDIDGSPPGKCCQWLRQRPPLLLKETSMAAPWEVLPAGLAVPTIVVREDVDGELPRRY
jgi:hypothetical protein